MITIVKSDVCIKIMYLNQCIKKFRLQNNEVIGNKIYNSMTDEEYSFKIKGQVVWLVTTTNAGKHYDAIHV